MVSIGAQILAARKKSGMTQEQLAAAMNMSRQGISHWENDRTMPDVEALAKLSHVLNCTFEVQGEDGQIHHFGITTEKESLKQESDADENGTEQMTENAPEKPAVAPDEIRSTSREINNSEEKSGKKQVRTVCAALGILMLVAVILLWVWPGFLKKTANLDEQTQAGENQSAGFQIADFQGAPENRKENAYLKVEPTLSVTENYWLYSFQCYEVNGIACSIQQVDNVYFRADGSIMHEALISNSELIASGAGAEIDAYGEWSLDGGLPIQQGVQGVGMQIHVKDENDGMLTFTGWLDFPAE